MLESIFIRVLHLSLSASWLILALCLFRLLLQKGPRNVMCWLWALAAVRLICPFAIESAFSMVPTRSEIITNELIYAEDPVVETGIEAVDRVIAPAVTEHLTPHLGASVNPIQIWLFAAEVLWVGGMVCMAAYAFISWLRLHRRVAPAISNRPGIFLCDDIDTPFVMGLLHPRIYLPSMIAEEVQLYVLAHEQAHLQRRDHLWKALGFTILTIHWFNPLCWLAYSLFCRDMELACDEKVIRSGTAEFKKHYAEALLSCSLPRGRGVFCPLAFGEIGVKDRIRAVLQYRKPTRQMIAAALLVLAAAVCFFMTDQIEVPEEKAVFAKTYDPFQNIYASPPLTESDYEVHYLPEVIVTEEHGLMIRDEGDQLIGILQEWELTRDNFDVLFREGKRDTNGPWSWPEDESWFRRNNYKAWRVIEDDDFYILMLQKDGSVLLCHGYYDAEGEMDPYSDDSAARWMVLLNPMEDAFAKAKTPYQWTNNITSEQVEWVSVTVWGQETIHHQPTQEQIAQLTSLLRSMTPDQVYESNLSKQHTVSVMVYCYGREYLLQYAGDGIVYMTFDSATAALYEDKRWVIEDERLGRWMEQWYVDETSDVVQWEYQPQLSSSYPAFPVFFDFDYKTLSLSGLNGTRKMIIGGMVDGNVFYSGGNGFCWTPMHEGEDAQKEPIALEGEVKISVTDMEGENLQGVLYFEVNDIYMEDPIQAAASSMAYPFYTVRLESEDLYIADNSNGEGILLGKIN